MKGSRTGGRENWNDTTVGGTVAAFMLMRGQHWLFSVGTFMLTHDDDDFMKIILGC